MRKKIVVFSVWIVLIILLIVLVVIFNKRNSNTKCSKVDIAISYMDDSYFLIVDDIQKLINKKGDSLVGKPLSKINLLDIEKNILKSPFVKKADVYATVDGVIKITIVQRKPIARVMNKYDQSFYIDSEGKLMPICEGRPARVLIADGEIREIFTSNTNLLQDSISKPDSVNQKSALYKSFMIARYIDADQFWKAQISDIYFNENGDIELLPLLGENKIIFGDFEFISEKFENLKTFYEKELSKVGWNKYKTINIKFKNQIVCSKK